MAETKLSNVRGIQEIAGAIPAELEQYTKEAFDDVSGVGEKSVYYSRMNAAGMVGYIFLFIFGAGLSSTLLIFKQELTDLLTKYLIYIFNRHGIRDFSGFLENIHLSTEDPASVAFEWLDICIYVFTAIGAVAAIVAIHGICRKIYSSKADSVGKKISKTTRYFEEQYKKKVLQQSFVNELYDAIENEEDLVLSESGANSDKLYRTVSKIKSHNTLFTRLTLISRIIIPALFFGGAIYVLYEWQSIGMIRFLLAFTLMLICNARLGLLMEFRVNKTIRFLLCLPSIAYGGFLGLFIYNNSGMFLRQFERVVRTESIDRFLFEGATSVDISRTVINRSYLTEMIIVAALQVLVLILAIALRNYRGEKKSLVEGVPKGSSKMPTNKGYLVFRIVTHILLMIVFILLNMYDGLEAIAGYTVFLGVFWRLVSPLWPVSLSKTVSRYWGTAYTLAVAMMELTFVMTMYVSWFEYVREKFLYMILMLGVSWVVFALIVIIGRRIKR